MTAPTTYCNECGASNPLQATYCFACNNPLQPVASSHLLQVQAASTSATSSAIKLRGPLFPSYLLHSRYNIVSQVGTGGFGAVYQAKDTLFSQRHVAIKEMNQEGLSTRELAEATAAFEHEALLLSNLTHPNLPRIHDHFSENGRSYVVMDFIAGDTLEDYQDKVVQRLPVEMVLEIGIQLCSVLDYLHTHQPPIIFRDIKPANIMRTADNHVYLIDFGIARHFKAGKAKDTIPLGSKGYAAPEQYGKTQTTPQTDIYGLGATLHELLTGDDPSFTLFHFESVPAGKRGKLPIASQLNALLKQMLEMEMSKRPASMAIVKQELQSLLAQHTAHYQSQVQRISQTPVKRRRFLIGLVSTVATCSLSCAIVTFLAEKPNLVDTLFAHPFTGTTPVLSSSPPVPVQATILNRPLYTYREHLGTVTAVAWSPNGQLIASAGALDSSVQVWYANTRKFVSLFHSHEKDLAIFVTNPQRVDALAWSPNSKQIAAALGNDAVDVWSIETGHPSLIPFNPPGNANALAWSPDGSKIAAVSANSMIQVRSAATGKISFTYPGHTQAVLTLAWSPDGQRIASGDAGVTDGTGGTVLVWPVTLFEGNGQQPKPTVVSYSQDARAYDNRRNAVQAVAWSPDNRYLASVAHDIQIFNSLTGKRIYTYTKHSAGTGSAVQAVAWSPNGRYIASGGMEGTIQVWNTSL